ncbi:energy-coupling factor ABC transporter ATP-binding protein [Cetobacterium sp.]|uniref:energy-coupling factor ABC transporter ATP-binding protein n=1 Tax=Cetobacterium sp. TaxID=2071632 RepID=UPI003F2E962A
MISLESIDFSYENKNVFRNISLNLEKGKFYIFLGENGSGKSTLVKLILGIEKPENGNIYINNLNLKENLFQCRKEIGMVFQNPDEQIVTDVVEEEIAFSMENYGIDSEIMLKKINKLLLEIGFVGRNNDKISTLSGGEKQRLCIASALALDPKILILDEGTAMLDEVNKKIILNLLKKLSEKEITIILITHHLTEIEFCDEVIYLSKGNITFRGSKIDFSRSLITGVSKHSFDLPTTFKVAIDVFKRTGVDVSENIFNFKQMGENLWKSL